MSNETKQTAVEWQHIELSKFLNSKSEFTDAHDILILAKEMEKQQRSIELPSDEQIDKESEWLDNPLERLNFKAGIKWMRDKIRIQRR